MRINRFFITAVLFVAVLACVVYYFKSLVIYLVISILVAALLRPLVDRITKLRIGKFAFPRGLAVFISYIVFSGIIGAFGSLFAPLISEQVEIIRNIDVDDLSGTVQDGIVSVEDYLLENELVDEQPGFLAREIEEKRHMMLSNLHLNNLVKGVASLTTSLLAASLAISFMTFFLIYEKGLLRKAFFKLVPNKYFELVVTSMYKVERLLSSYFVGVMIQMLVIFVLLTIGLSLVGMEYAPTVALFAAIANFIPYLGPLIGSLFGIFVHITTATADTGDEFSYITLASIAIVFGIVQLLDNVLLQPVIFSKSIKAHPMEIFVVIFAGATLGGIMGMVIAIPSYTILRVLVLEFFRGYKAYHVFSRRT